MNKFKEGFIKRAREYGVSKPQAENLYKISGLQEWLAEQTGKGIGSMDTFMNNGTGSHAFGQLGQKYDMSGLETLLAPGGAVAGAGIGALGGGTIGALNGKKDEHGETHRVRNALLGVLGGGLGGAALGAGTGYAAGNAVNEHPSNAILGLLKSQDSGNVERLKSINPNILGQFFNTEQGDLVNKAEKSLGPNWKDLVGNPNK